jgi:hypothetical protein
MGKARRFLLMFLKPLMNQHGKVDMGAGQAEDASDHNAVQVDENGFIAGTPYKSVTELIKGHAELKGLHDKQSNELGYVRGQAQTLAKALQETLDKETQARSQQEETGTTDYEEEIAAINEALDNLDPRSGNFQKEQTRLVNMLTDVKTEAAKEKILNTAGNMFQQELSRRDQADAIRKFNEEYPEFCAPEVQARIKEILAQDETGMNDAYSAFFKIRGDYFAAQAKGFSDQNAEIKKILELQRGKDSTGKVISKGQHPGQPSNKQRVSGKEADIGALAASRAARSE